MLQDSKTK